MRLTVWRSRLIGLAVLMIAVTPSLPLVAAGGEAEDPSTSADAVLIECKAEIPMPVMGTPPNSSFCSKKWNQQEATVSLSGYLWWNNEITINGESKITWYDPSGKLIWWMECFDKTSSYWGITIAGAGYAVDFWGIEDQECTSSGEILPFQLGEQRMTVVGIAKWTANAIPTCPWDTCHLSGAFELS